MADVTIYRKVVDVGTDRERAFYTLTPRAGYHPVLRLVGDFDIDADADPAEVLIGGVRYRIGQLSALRCLTFNLHLHRVKDAPADYSHGFYLVTDIAANDRPVIAIAEENFRSATSPDAWPGDPLGEEAKAALIARCENRTDFEIVEVFETGSSSGTYRVLLQDRTLLPMTLGG